MSSPLDNLGALRAWAASVRPVFICGQERSGTSALLLAMSRHPALFRVPDVFETFIFRHARDLLAEPPRRMQLAYLRGPDRLAALREALAHLGGGDAGALDDDDLVLAFFAFAAEAVYPGQRPLEKTPSHVHMLPRLFKLFPQAQVLACVREPTEVVDSYRRRLAREQAGGKPREAWGWLDQRPGQLIEQFRRIDRALAEAAEQFPGRVFRVPYGWLTSDPQVALSELCGFIGEPYDAAMLLPKKVARERTDPRLDEPLSAAPAQPASLLSAEELAHLRHATWGLTRRWRVPGIIAPTAAPAPPSPPPA
jgi:hypothetical protein